MTRIAENQLVGIAVLGVQNNRERIAKYSNEVTTGLKVTNPGDSNLSGSIAGFRDSLLKIDGYKNRVSTVQGYLTFQDDVLAEAENLLIRAKEIAEQAASSTNSDETRKHMAAEIFQIRDHLVSLANSKYQGKYIFGGTRDDTPPFINQATVPAANYTNPATGDSHLRWAHDGLAGRSDSKTVNITDNLSIVINSDADALFTNGVDALERLGRALDGYATNPAVGTPDLTGDPYVFPDGFEQQTLDIRATIDLLDTARETDILEERIALGGKLRRLDTADSLLNLSKVNTEELLDKLQNADTIESASNLAQAQTALEASFAVTSRLLNLNILDYI